MYTKKLSLNRLTIRTFSVFWIALFVMTTLLVILPYFDGHLYSELDDNEIATYQQKLVESIRNNKIKGLLAGVPVLPTDKFDSARPVLITPNKEVFGALGEEKTHILQFFDESTNFTIPQRKTFRDIQIAGPFKVYIGDAEEASELFFISRVNGQQEVLRYMLNHPWVLLLMTLIITTPLLWWFTYTIVKPITKLQKAANSVALGDFKVDNELANQGPSELREVGQSFNKMSIAINNLISNQHNLLSSISHELKTPLTRLQLATALVRHECGETDSVKRIEREIGRMDKMISELLLLSRQKMNSQMERDIFYANTLWTDIIKDAKFEAEQRGIAFLTNIRLPKNELQLNGNFRLLESAVENIVTNALKYTKDKIELHIFIQEEEEEEEEEFLRIRIDDNGSGVHPDEFEKITKQSEEYIAQIKARKGATVAYIPTTSRKNPQSKYWSGHGGKGGTIKDSKKDNEELRKEQSGK